MLIARNTLKPKLPAKNEKSKATRTNILSCMLYFFQHAFFVYYFYSQRPLGTLLKQLVAFPSASFATMR
jgi:hypothetical protein